MAIPAGHLPIGKAFRQLAMPSDHAEHWRLRLLELRDHLKQTKGATQASIAEKIGVAPDYLSRLLYEPGKKGRKNLGLDTMRSLRDAYGLPPDWFDQPLNNSLPSAYAPHAPAPALRANEPEPGQRPAADISNSSWPFNRVSRERLSRLASTIGTKPAREAIDDMDRQLEIVLLKWEHQFNARKSSSG